MYLSSTEWNRHKILIFDVDGTVCESCQPLTDEMAIVLSLNLHDKTLVFISGSSLLHIDEQITPYLQREHFHLLGTSGCEYAEVRGGKLKMRYRESLTTEEKEDIMSAFRQLIQVFSIKTHTTAEDQLQDRGTQITLSAIGRNAPSEEKKQYDPDGTKRKEWVRWLYTKLSPGQYNIKQGGTTSIDVTRKGMDKAYGIKRFCRENGFKLENVLFFGDGLGEGGNDECVKKIVDTIVVQNPDDTMAKLTRLFP